MTEGNCEKALLDLLLERGLLIFKYNNLLYQQIFCARQITGKLLEMINQLPTKEKITIIRIGDKLSDELDISEIKDRVKESYKICIKPEFEILHTINDNLFNEFLKYKSKIKVSVFYAEHNNRYRKSYAFNNEYFSKMNNYELFSLIKEYDKKRKGTHSRSEKTLFSILKDYYE